MPNRNRDKRITFWVTEQEYDVFMRDMEDSGIANIREYIMNILKNGYIVNYDTRDIRDLVRQLGITNNNLNQIAKRVNSQGSIYASDIEDLQQNYNTVRDMVELFMNKLSRIK